IKVVGFARNGEEAVEKTCQLKPDVLTLDIEMPGMNGLEALEIILKKNPLPVLMISSLTKDNAEVTLRALEIGALDYIPKNLSHVSLDIVKLEKEIISKIKYIAGKKVSFRKKVIPAIRPALRAANRGKYRIICIGSSTGGPGALRDIIPLLPPDLPCSILVAQHMPPGFTKAFAERLDAISKIRVKEAEDSEVLQNSTVYIAQGNTNLSIIRKGGHECTLVDREPRDSIYKPSVNVLINSVAGVYGSSAIGVILTGMGNDGLEGIRELKRRKGYVIAQDEATSIIYGMPRAIVESFLADRVCPLHEIVNELLKIV
ncbi:MAG: chemotaxis response regulator protein-glutamate methylesterase, partial [Actinobacteria bacterium]|nr:chemotaxis response regulator protein-glutamate methylesterase [Actinomycetota bacterium]